MYNIYKCHCFFPHNLGPLSETHLPIDSFTKKIKGFAFVTFMMPEHAVKAYTELDGTNFQGRLLHILPSKPKKDESELPGRLFNAHNIFLLDKNLKLFLNMWNVNTLSLYTKALMS